MRLPWRLSANFSKLSGSDQDATLVYGAKFKTGRNVSCLSWVYSRSLRQWRNDLEVFLEFADDTKNRSRR